jgi:hypothetical protein
MLKRLFIVDQEYHLTGWLFLRLLALIYAAAFLSLAVQIEGLVGPSGILPFNEALGYQHQRYGNWAWLLTPTLFWLNSSDAALFGATLLGLLFSLTLLFGRFERISLIALFVLYLSLFHAGQLFLNFQWDLLLLESGFLAIFLVGGVNRLSLLMFHWLLFRLRFESGLSKLLSGDPSWAGLKTLNYYFETQPLPHVGSWYAHQLPQWLHSAGTGAVLAAELLVPFFIFLPRRFRIAAAVITIGIQLLIIASSNHNFVNLLTILLCLFLLDDQIVQRIMPTAIRQRVAGGVPASLTRPRRIAQGGAAFLMFSVSVLMFLKLFVGVSLTGALQQYAQLGSRYGVGHVYHIFPNMQTERHELQIEGSDDGFSWQAYRFHYKPGALDQRPAFHIPHDPRLDWMIWFVPPQSERMLGWFNRFMWQLARNEPRVTALLRDNPFEGRAPPRYLRVLVYRYRFTSRAEREASGHWWSRQYLGVFPYVRPRDP